MKVKALSTDEVRELTKQKRFEPAYLLPYFKPDASSSGFYRLRLLGKSADEGQKYWQPPNTGAQLYMPPLLKGRKWDEIAKDPSIPIVIAEGEKKAAKACLKGIACVGVGGVWNWKAAKRGQALIPDLAAFEWKDRETILAFDSDTLNRPDLMAALIALADELTRRGGNPQRVNLPASADGEKVGLDDFLLTKSKDDFAALPLERFEMRRELADFNNDYALLRRPPGQILRTADLYVMRTKDFYIDAQDRKIRDSSANGIPRLLDASKAWLDWRYRRTFSELVYEPLAFDAPALRKDNAFNLWPGWGAKKPARDADAAKIWRALLDHLGKNASPEDRRWLEQWLAYPIQHPKTKLHSAVIIHGVQGAGKTMLGYAMREVYGKDNFSEIGQSDLHSQWNTWLLKKQFILADEVISSDKRADMNQIKSYITQKQVKVSEKFQASYSLDDFANYLFVSNDAVPLSLEDDDRRFAVFRCEAKLPEALRAAFGDMYLSEGGRNAIAWHLLNEVDLAGFDPNGDAPMSDAKLSVIANSRSQVNQFIEACIIDYNRVFAFFSKPPNCDFQTAETVAAAYWSQHKREASPVAVGRQLSKRAMQGRPYKFIRPIATEADGWQRIYAFRNLVKWRSATDAQATEHWNKCSPKQPEKDNPKFKK